MIRVNELKGEIATKGYSQLSLAKELGMTGNTFYRKMKKGVFDNTEIEAMIAILNITNPMDIFFAH